MSRPGNGVGRRWFCSILSILSVYLSIMESVRPSRTHLILSYLCRRGRSVFALLLLLFIWFFAAHVFLSAWLAGCLFERRWVFKWPRPRALIDTLELAAGVRVRLSFVVGFCNGLLCAGGAKLLSPIIYKRSSDLRACSRERLESRPLRFRRPFYRIYFCMLWGIQIGCKL